LSYVQENQRISAIATQLNFSDKRVLVVDGTTGIGLRVAGEFHALGATVAVNGISSDAVARTIKELGGGDRLIAAPGDLSVLSHISTVVPRALEELSGVDVLVTSTGATDFGSVPEITEAYWEQTLALNVKGSFFIAQACAQALKLTRGCIINIASTLGLSGGPAGSVVCSAAAGASLQMTRMMSLELIRYGVRVNSLCIGRIEPHSVSRTNKRTDRGGLSECPAAGVPFAEAGTVDDCVGAVLYLAGPYAGHTTGTTLVIDGGFSGGH
jgi:NAD(P)-dependent dehydrogenase (short-subunit alcohol dehydrogenase family)